MSYIIRIILGVAVLIGAFLVKMKAAPAIEEGEEAGATLSLWGHDMTPSSLSLIVVAFAIIGVVMIVMGLVGAMKRAK